MTTFQIVLLILAGGIFYLFFKQLFSGNYPKRGVDYEAKSANAQIGGINRPDKTFSKPQEPKSRLEELIEIADQSISEGNYIEAKKALLSAIVHNDKDIDILRRLGVVYMHMNDYVDAKEIFQRVLSIDSSDDLAHSSLANALHKLGEDEEALKEHQKAIELDPNYAPHYYNYANTLYDMGRLKEARDMYQKALQIDPNLKEAQKMLEELK